MQKRIGWGNYWSLTKDAPWEWITSKVCNSQVARVRLEFKKLPARKVLGANVVSTGSREPVGLMRNAKS